MLKAGKLSYKNIKQINKLYINIEMNAGKSIMKQGRARLLYGFQDYKSRSIQRFLGRSMSSHVGSQLKQERDALLEVLPSFTASIVKNKKFSLVPEASSWFQFLLDYTLPEGKTLRGMMTVLSYEAVEKPENLTHETLRTARTLAWCVELLHANSLIIDDVIDGSSTRHGKPCWHTQPNVGEWVMVDIMMMQGSLSEILKVNFKKHPLYADMLNLFNETLLYASIGEHLGHIISNRTKINYSMFTTKHYNICAKFKASYDTFRLPVLLGYLLANNMDVNLHRMVEDMCLDLGLLYQIQNDMLDFADESVTGKNETDIQEGKCTWFAVQVLRLSNDAQRAFFIENYADKDPAKVQNIKHLYEELKMPELYRKEEMFLYGRIKEKANMLPRNDSKLLLNVLHMIYKRKL